MADAAEALPQQLVARDIVEACRLELAYWIPILLTPLVQELKDLKNYVAIEKEPARNTVQIRDTLPTCDALQPRDTFCAAPASASVESDLPSSKPDNGSPSCLPSANLLDLTPSKPDDSNQSGAAAAATVNESPSAIPSSGDAITADKRSKTPHVAAKKCAAQEMEILSMPLVDAAGPPEDGSVPWETFRRPWSCRDLTLCCQQNPSSRGGYYLTPRCDTNDETDMEYRTGDVEMDEIMDPEAVKRLPQEITSLEADASAALEHLEDLDASWKNRRRPYEEDLASIQASILTLQEELVLAKMPKNQEPPPPGPDAFVFVASQAFTAVCNLVVLLNLAAMLAGPEFPSYAITFMALDQIFLTWYIVELSMKAVYYQCFLIYGKISVVWWNWLDLGIVVSGIVDQWLLPSLAAMNGGRLDIDTSALRMLRCLRLFRVMRFLRILKAFLKSDFAWAEGAMFEWCMAGVIALNSIVMSVEIDVPWAGWYYVENVLQVVYTFELAVRLKRQCCIFFCDMENLVWNYLDFIMVGGGALDLWLVPLIYMIQGLISGGSTTHVRHQGLSGALRILKIMRILRVLRLVRLLKMVKPLYRLLIGVIASIRAMQWVMVLTFLTLYACAIVFTDLVGKGLLEHGEVSASADEYFGSVPKSLFSLFQVMNGNMTPVAPITGSITGQLLFACFMVVSNWAILAVLTAVVSDNMINESQKANEEDERKKNSSEHQKRIRRLTVLFQEIDRDGKGAIDTLAWQKMWADRSLHRELCDATGLQKEDLNDYFECLAKDPRQEAMDRQTTSGRLTDLSLDYTTFIEALKDEGVLADKRSILHVMKQLRILESHVKREFERLGRLTRRSFA